MRCAAELPALLGPNMSEQFAPLQPSFCSLRLLCAASLLLPIIGVVRCVPFVGFCVSVFWFRIAGWIW